MKNLWPTWSLSLEATSNCNPNPALDLLRPVMSIVEVPPPKKKQYWIIKQKNSNKLTNHNKMQPPIWTNTFSFHLRKPPYFSLHPRHKRHRIAVARSRLPPSSLVSARPCRRHPRCRCGSSSSEGRWWPRNPSPGPGDGRWATDLQL